MVRAIEEARYHVHVEFYIVQPDETGRRLRETLVRRAREGVEVRVLCDALGSVHLPGDFWRPLVEAGGEAAFFRPVGRVLRRLHRRDRVDFRNHRKLVIADGRVGFTGGINVGREYLGLDPTMGYWRDTHVGITGPAVLSLQAAFAEDWVTATGRLLDDERYFPDPAGHDDGPYRVQIIDSGPDRSWSPIAHVFTQAYALARERIWVTSPYFIPTPAVENGLIGAALRGVDVRLLLPLRPDHPVAMAAASSYFPPLLEAGVRIFRYRRGFVHAKTLVVDDWVSAVGSANLDLRSFHLNFELNALVYGREFAVALAAQFLRDLEQAQETGLAHERSLGTVARVLRAGARLLSPLL
jgi:cardiolipin synthase